MQFTQLITQLKQGTSLDEQQATQAFEQITSGNLAQDDIAQFLLALKDKGETWQEIYAAAKTLRSKMLSPNIPADIANQAFDSCGTGGDGLHTLNISTATAFVLAACGVYVAKHGNKSVSSKSGSADVLGELDVDITANQDKVASNLINNKLCFLFAPLYHPAMKHVAPVRAKLKTRTIFNLLGPLLNPLQVKRQIIGVYSPDLLEPYARVLRKLGTQKAWIVHSAEGMDEISISAKTHVAELDKGSIDIFDISPEDVGLKTLPLEQIKGGDATYNANAMLELFNGKESAYKQIVLFNAGSALLVAGKVNTIEQGIKKASTVLLNGDALKVLESIKY